MHTPPAQVPKRSTQTPFTPLSQSAPSLADPSTQSPAWQVSAVQGLPESPQAMPSAMRAGVQTPAWQVAPKADRQGLVTSPAGQDAPSCWVCQEVAPLVCERPVLQYWQPLSGLGSPSP